MATYTYINGDLSKLKTVLENSGYFDSVETGTVTGQKTTNSGLKCMIGTLSFFEIGLGTVTYGNQDIADVWTIDARCNTYNAQYLGVFTGYSAATKSNYRPVSTHQAANGLVIHCNAGRILITRNQNGDVVVVFGTGYSTTNTGSTVHDVMLLLAAVCVEDDDTFRSFRTNNTLFNQTLLTPICTCASTKSYTDHAFWMSYKQYIAVGYIQYNGKRYFTDGFYAVEDEEETT